MGGFFNFVSLEEKIRYTLGKQERLKSRKTIEYLFKEGKSFSIFPFRILYSLTKAPLFSTSAPVGATTHRLQSGFTASTRNFKKAVDRNRVKRLMREAYRLQKSELQQIQVLNNNNLAVFIIYTGKQLPDYSLICEKMTVVLKRLIKLTSENR